MIFCHYNKVENLGDRLCCPKLYFPEWDNYPTNFLYYDRGGIALSSGPIVIGGGGVMVKESQGFYDFLFTLKRHCIIWGSGTNGGTFDLFWMPDQISQFRLVGVRDFGVGLPYVPCPSCLHPAFSSKGIQKHDFIVIESKEIPISIDAPIHLNTFGSWLIDVIQAIISAKVVLTNSYHGAYWSMLLKRRVVLVNAGTNRFQFLKYKPPFCDLLNWREHLNGDLVAPLDFIDECRDLNLDFATKVREVENG